MSEAVDKEQQFDEMSRFAKMRALGALERLNDQHEEERPIREDVEKHGDRVLEITKFANYHFVKVLHRFNKETSERYEVYIDGKRCHSVTTDPKMLLLLALANDIEGSNTRAPVYMAKMLGMKNDWTKERE